MSEDIKELLNLYYNFSSMNWTQNLLQFLRCNFIKYEQNNKNSSKLISKIWGDIYLPKGMSVPQDQDEDDMVMLAQVNLQDLKLHHSLPKHGILQFYLAKDGNSNIDFLWESNDTDDFRIVYFHCEDESALITFPNEIESQEELPISFLEQEDGPNPGTIEAEQMWFGDDYDGNWKGDEDSDDENFDDEDFDDTYKNECNKFFGCPGFYQRDPRVNSKKYKDYILLLQLDCGTDRNLHFLWNFPNVTYFIHPDDLEKHNFDNVMINYDCD